MSQTRYVNVEVLETTPEYVKLKLPFLENPVTMNHPFFKSRLEKGYLKFGMNKKVR